MFIGFCKHKIYGVGVAVTTTGVLVGTVGKGVTLSVGVTGAAVGGIVVGVSVGGNWVAVGVTVGVGVGRLRVTLTRRSA